VRKEFKPQRKDSEYELELRNLSILRRLKHPNIIELLGAYIYRDKYNLIFPLARGGTLADLITNLRPPVGRETALSPFRSSPYIGECTVKSLDLPFCLFCPI
jgi:serine/threonine protein kinase